MPRSLNTTQPDFDAAFAAFLARARGAEADVSTAVATIIAEVKLRGDGALFDYTKRFDRFALTADNLRVRASEVAEAKAAVPPEALAALKVAAERIEAFHCRHKPRDDLHTDETGVTLGARWTPVDAAGLYVPGGLAAYPSSVLMNAIPAKIAGVKRLVAATPAPDGKLNPLVLAAADLVGVNEIYRIGGAQAIAALAYGTKTIAPVDKIVGPGNAYVAAAKRQVFGQVGIDSIAGPSEVLIVADKANDPAWIAADLLAQAEHDETAQSILITDDEMFARAVALAVEKQLTTLPREKIARASWDAHGAIIRVRTLDEAPALADRIAAEHVQLCVADPNALARRIKHAGAIFLGAHTPEAIGDYVGGPNHVLPTARAARFSSGLSVLDFMKRTTILGCSAESLSALGKSAATLADAEGLAAHARSIRIRLNR
ncbi:MAG: histidinol dehydrogenase [Alphaproteobacteria bacterium]|nr:histidinol dehydrogenase [Alphaproteobacteria bacterium]